MRYELKFDQDGEHVFDNIVKTELSTKEVLGLLNQREELIVMLKNLHLCDSCIHEYPECTGKPIFLIDIVNTPPPNDGIVECNEYMFRNFTFELNNKKLEEYKKQGL